jgi:hypothetical protein
MLFLTSNCCHFDNDYKGLLLLTSSTLFNRIDYTYQVSSEEDSRWKQACRVS